MAFLDIAVENTRIVSFEEVSSILQDLKEAMYPVGSLYTSMVAVVPSFGTWVPYAEGRMLIGAGTSDQVFTAGDTGGESTHVLTLTELAAHTHGFSINGVTGAENQTHTHTATTYTEPLPDAGVGSTASGQEIASGSTVSTYISTATPTNHVHDMGSGATATVSYEGSGDNHNNLPPYSVVYIFIRTA